MLTLPNEDRSCCGRGLAERGAWWYLRNIFSVGPRTYSEDHSDLDEGGSAASPAGRWEFDRSDCALQQWQRFVDEANAKPCGTELPGPP